MNTVLRECLYFCANLSSLLLDQYFLTTQCTRMLGKHFYCLFLDLARTGDCHREHVRFAASIYTQRNVVGLPG